MRALKHLGAVVQLLLLQWGVEKDAHGDSTLSARSQLLMLVVILENCRCLLNASIHSSLLETPHISSQLAMHQGSLLTKRYKHLTPAH